MPASAYAERTANILLDIEAVHINAVKPFILTSGWASPVYIDCRKIISFVNERRQIIRDACDVLKSGCDVSKIDYVAGGETAGIAYAAWIAEALDKPMLYVRKKPKGFGRGAQIEGSFPEGARVLLVEDLATDGASKVTFANVLRDAGGIVDDVFSVFFYGIFAESAAILSEAKLKLHYLATWQDVLKAARARSLADAATLREVEQFLANPSAWSAAHGGTAVRAKL